MGYTCLDRKKKHSYHKQTKKISSQLHQWKSQIVLFMRSMPASSSVSLQGKGTHISDQGSAKSQLNPWPKGILSPKTGSYFGGSPGTFSYKLQIHTALCHHTHYVEGAKR